MLKKIVFTVFMISMTSIFLVAQEAGVVDTTDVRYRIGYKIGTYLPITIILLLALLFISRAYRFKEK